MVDLDPDAEQVLLRYGWPGNVREVENVINRARILAEGSSITVEEIPSKIVRATLPLITSASALVGQGSLRDSVRQFEAGIILRAIEDAGG